MIRSYRARPLSARAPGRWLLAAAAAALIPVLAGCEAGNDAPTLAFHYPTDSAGVAHGSLSVRNVFVLGAPIGRNLPAGQSASLFLSLVNNSPDRDVLTSITAPGSAMSVQLPAGGITVVRNHPVFLSGPQPQLALRGLTRPLRSGQTIRLVLHFRDAGPVVLMVPVMPRAVQYATLQPPAPAPASPQAHPSPSPSPSP